MSKQTPEEVQTIEKPFKDNPTLDKGNDDYLQMVKAECCLCDSGSADMIATGKDFEYQTSKDEFSVFQCNSCSLVYLNPRPQEKEFERIYPASYHAFEFSEQEFGFVYKVRRKLEAKRLLSWCEGLPADARILDVGCGDGFHLDVLKEFGKDSWWLEGIDVDERAVQICKEKGLKIHHGTLESADLPKKTFDLVILIQTIEHVAEPTELLKQIDELMSPGGRLVIVTDNTDSLDFTLFKRRHWGGYHFPRHWYLFNKFAMKKLAQKTGFEIEKLTTQVSPVNWTYSVRNALFDRNAPMWLVNFFSLKSTPALSFFTAFDTVHQIFGKGALLNVFLRRPD